MADNDDDFYNDPDLFPDDDNLLKPDDLPADEQRDLSQTPYLPEAAGDDRGSIDELDEPDAAPADYDPADDKYHPDNDTPLGVEPPIEQDGTEE